MVVLINKIQVGHTLFEVDAIDPKLIEISQYDDCYKLSLTAFVETKCWWLLAIQYFLTFANADDTVENSYKDDVITQSVTIQDNTSSIYKVKYLNNNLIILNENDEMIDYEKHNSISSRGVKRWKICWLFLFSLLLLAVIITVLSLSVIFGMSLKFVEMILFMSIGITFTVLFVLKHISMRKQFSSIMRKYKEKM